jgi:hypothetical protein
VAVERGALNKSLSAIRDASKEEGIAEEDLAIEITLRAAAYRRTYPGLPLTPMALAKHWFRVIPPQTKGHVCPVCNLRFKGPQTLLNHLANVHHLEGAPTAVDEYDHPF